MSPEKQALSVFWRHKQFSLFQALAIAARTCRHCGAALLDGESENDCSSAFNIDDARLRWRAAQILRGLI